MQASYFQQHRRVNNAKIKFNLQEHLARSVGGPLSIEGFLHVHKISNIFYFTYLGWRKIEAVKTLQ
jgi:hypothetical protein